jgi:cation diffusion facilitator family transporter
VETTGASDVPRALALQICRAMAAESRTAVLAALLGNGALAILKGVAAAVTGSAAMLAETFHSIADTGNQGLLLLGLRLARRPPDAAHPFGHGKNVYFWAFVVSMMLFSLGGAFSIWEAVRKILHPGEHEAAVWWTFGVLGGGVVFEAISLGVAVRSLRQAQDGRSLRQYFHETRDPMLITVVFEDSAALLSLFVAAGGIGLSVATGNVVWDAVASGVIGLVLIGVAVFLAFENYSLLVGESAPGRIQARVREAARGDEAVQAVVAVHTMHVGPHAVLVVLGVHFAEDLTTDRLERAVARVQDRVRRALGGDTDARLVVIEPTRPETRTFGAAA